MRRVETRPRGRKPSPNQVATSRCAALETPDIISLEEAEEAGVETAIEEDEELVDLGDDAAEIPAAADNAFLEEQEEGEADVSGIIGTPSDES